MAFSNFNSTRRSSLQRFKKYRQYGYEGLKFCTKYDSYASFWKLADHGCIRMIEIPNAALAKKVSSR